MIPVLMTVTHDPPNGLYGDCFRASIASILERAPMDIPHFCDEGADDHWHDDAREWFHKDGLDLLEFAYADVDGYQYALNHMATYNRGVYYLLTGMSTAGGLHTVVCLNDKIVHDPANRPLDQCFIGPDENGYYWISVIGHVVAYRGGPMPNQWEKSSN